MGTVAKLQARASRSRRAGAAEPVVETVEQALALARAIARDLDGLQGDARLLMLSNLDEVRQALDDRSARLESELAVERERLRAVNRGLRAVSGYAAPRPPRSGGRSATWRPTSAGSALTTAQYRMAVSQTNVANVDDETYSRKTVATSATSTTSAVTNGTVSRAADAFLSKAVVTTASAASRDSVTDTYMQSYDASLGSVDGGDDIASLLDAFQTALSGLASASSTASAKAQVVSAASAAATALNGLSTDIQALRSQANSEIADTVDAINESLSTLKSLNDQIVTVTAQGGDTTTLEDQRAAELETLSSMIGISSYVTSDNRVQVYTSSGDQLLGASAATLSYTASSSLSADTVYPTSISGLTLNGKDITTATTNGSLGALITLRDTTLTGEQDALDALASALITQVNAVGGDIFTGTDAGDIAVSATLLADPTTLTSDSTVASALVTALTSDVSFSAAGKLSAGSSSLLDYASSFVSTAAKTISAAADASESSTAAHDAATTRLSNLTAVNLDEELALLETYEQAYQANAQLVSMMQDLFDALISMVN